MLLVERGRSLKSEPADSFCPAVTLFLLAVLKVIKDRVCLRALEKMIHQLADSKEQAEVLAATALQPLDVNADGTHASPAVSTPARWKLVVIKAIAMN